MISARWRWRCSNPQAEDRGVASCRPRGIPAGLFHEHGADKDAGSRTVRRDSCAAAWPARRSLAAGAETTVTFLVGVALSQRSH